MWKLDTELIKVYVHIDENGRTACICPRWKKRCDRECTLEVVERDKYRGWEKCCRVDRYGRAQADYEE